MKGNVVCFVFSESVRMLLGVGFVFIFIILMVWIYINFGGNFVDLFVMLIVMVEWVFN